MQFANFILAHLRINRKLPKSFDLVTKKFNTNWKLVRDRKNINDSTTNRILTAVFN